MSDGYHITHFEDRDQAALSIIGPGIHGYNRAQAGGMTINPSVWCCVDRTARSWVG